MALKKPRYEILSKRCLSSSHNAFIPGVISGGCECGNCKIRIRQHRDLGKNAWHEIPRSHDYVFDREEVLEIRRFIIKN